MKVRFLFSFWYLPILGIIIGILFAFVYKSGLAVTWQYIGKPSSNISKIVGFVGNKLFLITENGDAYSITYEEYLIVGDDSIPKQAEWVKEGNNSIVADSIRNNDLGFIILPPLFKVKQEYVMEFPNIEGSSLVKFVLAEDGNLWMWNYGVGAYTVLSLCLVPIFGGIVGGILALILKFGIYIRKRTKIYTHY